LIFSYNTDFTQLWSAKIGPHFTHWSAGPQVSGPHFADGPP